MGAIERRNTGIIVLLLNQPGININVRDADGETALDWAKRTGRRNYIRLILSKMGPHDHDRMDLFREEDKKISTPVEKIHEKFWFSISQGDINEIESLLEEKNTIGKPLISIDAKNKNGDTALIVASDMGNLELVRLLLEYKADLSLKDAHGNNALIRAAKKGHLFVVEELLFQQANINSTGQDKRTALIAAAENGHICVVRLLIKKGAKVSIKDNYNKVALDIVNGKLKKMNKSHNKYEYYKSIKTILEKETIKQTNSSFESVMENISYWDVVIEKRYDDDLKVWEKNDPVVYNKIQQLIGYIKFDPFRGLGRMERLTGDLEGLFSRRINKQNRIVYEIDGEKVILKSCKGHYEREKRSKTRTTSKTK